VALAGPGDRGSELVVRARVGPGGELRWLPEPAVAAAGCRHRVAARVVLAAGAGLMWREELVGGRHGEPAGSLASRLDLELAGRPLYRSELGLGPGHPGWDGPAGTAGARAAGSVVVVRPAWAEGGPPPAAVVAGGLGAVLPLAGPGAVVAAVGPGAASLRAALAEGLAALV